MSGSSSSSGTSTATARKPWFLRRFINSLKGWYRHHGAFSEGVYATAFFFVALLLVAATITAAQAKSDFGTAVGSVLSSLSFWDWMVLFLICCFLGNQWRLFARWRATHYDQHYMSWFVWHWFAFLGISMCFIIAARSVYGGQGKKPGSFGSFWSLSKHALQQFVSTSNGFWTVVLVLLGIFLLGGIIARALPLAKKSGGGGGH